jgi:hypothetical protein
MMDVVRYEYDARFRRCGVGQERLCETRLRFLGVQGKVQLCGGRNSSRRFREQQMVYIQSITVACKYIQGAHQPKQKEER